MNELTDDFSSGLIAEKECRDYYIDLTGKCMGRNPDCGPLCKNGIISRDIPIGEALEHYRKLIAFFTDYSSYHECIILPSGERLRVK